VILAVLGTHDQPFPRAARLAASLALGGERLVVQHGCTSPVADVRARWIAWATRADLDELIRDARVVVVHGGSGCIFQALRAGARPVVVPRLARFGEHVDDHQLQLGARLERDGHVVVWRDADDAASINRRLASLTGADVPPPQDLRPAVWSAARALTGRVTPAATGG
jgi:UDP-N-acetylglucosamine transferase subunit ALG13